MQAMTAVKAEMKSSPPKMSRKVITTMLMKYRKMNPRMAKTTLLGICMPPTVTGAAIVGWIMRVSSRELWRTRIRVRIILIPPPVEPELTVTEDRNNIQKGTKMGHWA